MAKIGNLSVNLDIEISEETVHRCCQILQMYLTDNPEKKVICEWTKADGDLKEYALVFIGAREETKDER